MYVSRAAIQRGSDLYSLMADTASVASVDQFPLLMLRKIPSSIIRIRMTNTVNTGPFHNADVSTPVEGKVSHMMVRGPMDDTCPPLTLFGTVCRQLHLAYVETHPISCSDNCGHQFAS